MSALAEKSCIPCRGGVPPLGPEQILSLHAETPEWSVIDQHHLRREFRFPDFATALGFVNQIGEVAETEGHHPDIELAWGRVALTVWTHKINGLTESDFVFAAKVDQITPTP